MSNYTKKIMLVEADSNTEYTEKVAAVNGLFVDGTGSAGNVPVLQEDGSVEWGEGGGEVGPTGPAGPTGNTGPAGPTGLPGEKTEPWSSLIWISEPEVINSSTYQFKLFLEPGSGHNPSKVKPYDIITDSAFNRYVIYIINPDPFVQGGTVIVSPYDFYPNVIPVEDVYFDSVINGDPINTKDVLINSIGFSKNFDKTDFNLTKVLTKVDQLTNINTTTVTISTANWVEKVAVKEVLGVTATSILWISPSPASWEDYVAAEVKATAQNTNSITFACENTPIVDIVVNVAFA
jgi:hypothetical protein